MKKDILFTFLLFWSFQYLAQEVSGDHVRNQNWKVIEGPVSTVIFPAGLDSQATVITNNISYLNANNIRSVGPKAKKLTVLLNNRLVVSNGFVGLAPFRSEFFTVPFQNIAALGTTNWLDLLSIHEYRHSQQFSNTMYGLSKFGYLLAGEPFWGALFNLSIPNWYLEGDAVIQETALSEQGRGRIPYFSRNQRAIADAGINYRYSKIRNGSFKDLVPDHYKWGYLMLSHLRNESGNDVSAKVLKESAAYTYFFYPFSRALKANSGFTTNTLYKASWENAKAAWDTTLQGREIIASSALSDSSLKTVTFYSFPRISSDGSIYVHKNTYKETEQIVQLKNGEETKIARQGENIDAFYDTKDEWIVWTEYRLNPRRGNETYNDLILYNTTTKEKKKITQHGKYFSPIFSASGDKVFALKVDLSMSYSIVEFDLHGENERILKQFKPNEFPSRLCRIYKTDLGFILKQDNQVALWKLNIKTGEMLQLSPWTHHTMDAPYHANGQVYFSASFNQIDNIFRVPTDGSKKIEQLSSVKFGAYDPVVSDDGKTIYYSETILNGQKVSALNINNALLQKVSITEPADQVWLDKVAAKEEGGSILDKVPYNEYPVKDYKGFLKGMKIYSWFINPFPVEPSLDISATNYLQDVHIIGSIGYNSNEESTLYGARIDFARYFPVFSFVTNQRFRETEILGFGDSIIDQSFIETQIGGEISVPLNWNLGNYYAGFKPKLYYNHLITSNRTIANQEVEDFDYQLIGAELNYLLLRRNARQQIAPRLGILLNADYSRNIASSEINEKLNASSTVFLPGFYKTHSLQVRTSFQKELLSNSYQLSDDFFYSRGFETPISDEFKLISLNYGLPFTYPDWGILGMTYFKRMRLNAFFDYGEGDFIAKRKTTYYSSVGGELIFDNVMLNILPLSFGIRGSSLLTKDPNSPDSNFSLGFFIASDF